VTSKPEREYDVVETPCSGAPQSSIQVRVGVELHDPPRKILPHEVGNFDLRGSVCARLAGTIAVNVTQVIVSSKGLETVG
jgi:hypothetical protein